MSDGDQFFRLIQGTPHHRGRSFEEEWIALLKRHGIEFDPANPFG